VAGGDDVTSRLGDIWRQARELKSETRLLRQVHVEHVTGTKQLLQATFVKIKVRLIGACCFEHFVVSMAYCHSAVM